MHVVGVQRLPLHDVQLSMCVFSSFSCSQLTTHLQCVWLSEVRHPSDSHRDPHVDHLSGDVAKWQVADHHFLTLRGVCQTHVLAGGERRPC